MTGISSFSPNDRREFPVVEHVKQAADILTHQWTQGPLLGVVHSIGLTELETVRDDSHATKLEVDQANATYASLQSNDILWLLGDSGPAEIEDFPELEPHGIDGLTAGTGSLWLETPRVHYGEDNHVAIAIRGFSWIVMEGPSEDHLNAAAIFIHRDSINPVTAVIESTIGVNTIMGPIVPVGAWGGPDDWTMPSTVQFPEIGTLTNTFFETEEIHWPPNHPGLRVLQHALLSPQLQTISGKSWLS